MGVDGSEIWRENNLGCIPNPVSYGILTYINHIKWCSMSSVKSMSKFFSYNMVWIDAAIMITVEINCSLGMPHTIQFHLRFPVLNQDLSNHVLPIFVAHIWMVNMVRNTTGNNASSIIPTKISPYFGEGPSKTPPKSPTKSLKKGRLRKLIQRRSTLCIKDTCKRMITHIPVRFVA